METKNFYLGIIVVCPLLWTSQAEAVEILYAPSSCDPASLTLTAQNKGSTAQTLGLQTASGLNVKLSFYTVPAQGSLNIKGSDFLAAASGFSLRMGAPDSLALSLQCGSDHAVAVQNLTSPEVDHWLPVGSSQLQLSVMNLFLQSNNVHLQFYDENSHIIGEQSLPLTNYYETQTLQLAVPVGARRLHISATDRVSTTVVAEGLLGVQQSPAFIFAPMVLSPPSNQVYFLVSNKAPATIESFVVGISDPTLIAAARDQVAHPTESKILAGSISVGDGGFNRAFASPDKSPYTWSVSKVSSFGDFGSNDCDGDPDSVELMLNQRMQEGGRICFWQFHISRELSLEEVAQGELRSTLTQP